MCAQRPRHSAAEAGRAPDVLVLGVGNVLMSDEGIGVRAVEALGDRVPKGVRVLAPGGIGVQILPEVAAADRLLVLDCVDGGLEPGRLVRLDGEDLNTRGVPTLSPHEFSLADLLSMAALGSPGPTEVVVLGVQPGLVTVGTELSPPVAVALPRLLDAAAGVLEGWIRQGRTLPGPGGERPQSGRLAGPTMSDGTRGSLPSPAPERGRRSRTSRDRALGGRT